MLKASTILPLLDLLLPEPFYLTADKIYSPCRRPCFQPMVKGNAHHALTPAEIEFNTSLTDTRAMVEW